MDSTDFSSVPFGVYYSKNPNQKQISEMIRNGVRNVFLDFSNYPLDSVYQKFDPVIYFNVGTYETFRKYSSSCYPKHVIGKPVEGWSQEYWLDLESEETMECLKGYIKKTIQFLLRKYPKWVPKIDLDNLDGWEAETGFEFGKKEVVQYANEIISWFKKQFSGFACCRNSWEILDGLNADAILCEEALEDGVLDEYRNFKKPLYAVEYYSNSISAFLHKTFCKRYIKKYENLHCVGGNWNLSINYFQI